MSIESKDLKNRMRQVMCTDDKLDAANVITWWALVFLVNRPLTSGKYGKFYEIVRMEISDFVFTLSFPRKWHLIAF